MNKIEYLRVDFFQVRPNSSNFEKNGFFAPRKDFRVQGGLRFSQTIRQTLRLRIGYKPATSKLKNKKYFDNFLGGT